MRVHGKRKGVLCTGRSECASNEKTCKEGGYLSTKKRNKRILELVSGYTRQPLTELKMRRGIAFKCM